MNLSRKIQIVLASKKALVKRRAEGFLKHDYLVPGGPYEEQWDWDGFFIGVSLASEIPSEAIYLKNWALNYLENVGTDGFTPGLLTPKGPGKRLKHIKPLLAQGVYFASRSLKDFVWVKPYWKRLKKSLLYRQNQAFDSKSGLACWYDSMESGADNNPAVLDFPKRSIAGADLNALLYREYQAASKIAKNISAKNDAKFFSEKAKRLRRNILKYLWNDQDQSFYNLDTRSGRQIKRIVFSNFLPLWVKLIPRRQGRKMIEKYLLNPKKLWAEYGIRTLAADDPEYNQKNIIKPYSNWQGPVWPLVNYFAWGTLLNYGFNREANTMADRTAKLVLNDIEQSGGMHENYNADTGRPLAAPNFISWNLLVSNMFALV